MDVSVEQHWDYSSLIKPCAGEELSGDVVVIQTLESGLFVAVADVLGHGPKAHELTLVIQAYLGRYANSDVGALMSGLHQHLQGSRGAVAVLCAMNSETGCAAFAGIGNVSFRRFGSENSRLVSQYGVLGQNMRSPRIQTLQLEANDTVLIYSDGVNDHFTLDDYPGLLCQEPSQVSSNVIARFGKGHDDAACVAIRYTL